MILDMTEDTLTILPPDKVYLTVVNIGTEENPASGVIIQRVADYYKKHKNVLETWEDKKTSYPSWDETPYIRDLKSYPIEVSTTYGTKLSFVSGSKYCNFLPENF